MLAVMFGKQIISLFDKVKEKSIETTTTQIVFNTTDIFSNHVNASTSFYSNFILITYGFSRKF